MSLTSHCQQAAAVNEARMAHHWLSPESERMDGSLCARAPGGGAAVALRIGASCCTGE